jgi:preprotein translocase subunit SecF
MDETEHQKVLDLLRKKFENKDEKVLEDRFETVGPAVSTQLRTRAVYAVLAVLIGIIVYIAYSFRRVSRPVASWKYGVVAVAALIHDVTITMGVFAILGHYFGVEVDVPFVVALLTILGYSVNDTIVVFDRVRENLIKRSVDDFADTVNVAINETLARSLNTTATTLFTLLALFVFGGATIKWFTLALLIGIFLGAYSSIFVASPLLVEWKRWQDRPHA